MVLGGRDHVPGTCGGADTCEFVKIGGHASLIEGGTEAVVFEVPTIRLHVVDVGRGCPGYMVLRYHSAYGLSHSMALGPLVRSSSWMLGAGCPTRYQ